MWAEAVLLGDYIMPRRAVRQRRSFRSLRAAVEAACDGDCVLLLRGVHNGMGCVYLPQHISALAPRLRHRAAAAALTQALFAGLAAPTLLYATDFWLLCGTCLGWHGVHASSRSEASFERGIPHRDAVVVTKRLLIRGAGALGDTRLDQRANSPALRLERACVVENLDVDMTGFREALHVAVAAPLIQRCILRRGADHPTAASG